MSIVDVAVVGGGPAGSAAASVLASQGLRVIVLDRAQTRKPCGGYLPVKALRRMPKMAVSDLLVMPVRTVRLVGQHRRTISVGAGETLGYVLRRQQLDHRLLDLAEQAGATVWRSTRVLGHERFGNSTRIQSDRGSLHARYLIAADGVHGRTAVAAGVRRPFPRWQLAFARVAELRWKGQPADFPLDQIQLLCQPILGGFGWVFPLPDGANVGVAGSSFDLDRVQRQFAALLAQLGATVSGFDLIWNHGWWLPAGGLPRRLTAARTFLVGDAAGFVDCFSGEGIYYAVASGQLAAHAITHSFSDPEQAERHYRRDCAALLQPTLRRSLLLSGLIGRGKDRYFRALHRQPRLAMHLLDMMREEQPYHGCTLPLLIAQMAAHFTGIHMPDDLQVLGANQWDEPAQPRTDGSV